MLKKIEGERYPAFLLEDVINEPISVLGTNRFEVKGNTEGEPGEYLWLEFEVIDTNTIKLTFINPINCYYDDFCKTENFFYNGMIHVARIEEMKKIQEKHTISNSKHSLRYFNKDEFHCDIVINATMFNEVDKIVTDINNEINDHYFSISSEFIQKYNLDMLISGEHKMIGLSNPKYIKLSESLNELLSDNINKEFTVDLMDEAMTTLWEGILDFEVIDEELAHAVFNYDLQYGEHFSHWYEYQDSYDINLFYYSFKFFALIKALEEVSENCSNYQQIPFVKFCDYCTMQFSTFLSGATFGELRDKIFKLADDLQIRRDEIFNEFKDEYQLNNIYKDGNKHEGLEI